MDEKLAPLVFHLWLAGCATASSCESLSTHGDREACVLITFADGSSFDRAVELLWTLARRTEHDLADRIEGLGKHGRGPSESWSHRTYSDTWRAPHPHGWLRIRHELAFPAADLAAFTALLPDWYEGTIASMDGMATGQKVSDLDLPSRAISPENVASIRRQWVAVATTSGTSGSEERAPRASPEN
ncbi:MAG: hypothetical protein M3O32_01280 [Actinomycetota bacterium]|nr:hypothetical protein [Actinomycetota bacterium]